MIKTQELSDPNSCINRALPDELCFVLLGRDKAAPVAIMAWVNERLRLGTNTLVDPEIVDAIKCATSMAIKQTGRYEC